MKLEFGKFLTCSTGNILGNDALRLDEATKQNMGSVPALIVYKYAEGYFVYVSNDPKVFETSQREVQSEGYSSSLFGLLKLAYENKCDFLRIDCDGPEVDGFKTFEW